MEQAKNLQRQAKQMQDEKTKEKNRRPVIKLGKKLMTQLEKKNNETKTVEKPRPQFEKAFNAYLGLNFEENPDLTTTQTYKDGLVSTEWDGDNYN